MNVNPQQALDDLLRSRSLQHWYGLRGSSRALLLAAVQQRLNRPLLVLAESFEKAEQLVEDIAWFLGRDGLWLFPQWDTLPYDNFSPHKEIVGRRMATLHALQAGEVRCLVTTPPAMMQKLMPVDEFLSAHFELRVGVPSKREDLLQQLPEWGYSQVDTVEEQGEFSAHGNLIDLFPVNQAQPVRLGWKKDRLHTLQPFQIETQLTEGELETLLVLPAREVLFSKAHLQQARKQLNQYRDQMSANLLQQMKRRLADGEAFPGMESLLPLFYEKLQTLFDYLPEDIYVVLEESEHVHNRAQHFYNEVFMEYELSVQQENLSVSPETMYLDHRQLESELSQRAKLNVAQARQPEQPDQVLHWRAFACSDNRGLRQGFERAGAASAVGHVINLLQQWRAANTPVFLSAKTQTAADHFRQLLGDLGIEAHVAGTELRPESMPWLEWLSGATPPTVGEPLAPLPILVGELSAGFRWLNEQGQPDFALLTEEEVFGEKSKRRRLTRAQVQTLGNSLEDLKEGDPVVHLDYGIGRYVGLKKIPVGDSDSDFMVLEYARNEKVYVPVQKFHLVQKYVNADGTSPKLNKLGDKAWTKTRSKVAKSVEDIAGELTEIYAARRARKGFSFPADDHEMQEFELRFPYEETPDQLQVIEAVKADMEAETPMDRLVCGDVGFGKTEIAMRAAFKCANAGKQVAVLVPTTILAQQHFVSFKKRFDGTPFNIEMLSRFRTATEQRDVLKNLRDGKVDILIGTHRLLSQDVKFPQLGLLVVDEEQRFGVKHKEKIKAFRAEVDVLTLSATPIPRTLYMSMTGIRDLSIINTPPADRMAIRTRLLKSNDYIIQEAVSREIRRGGQIYVVHNRVESIFQYGNYLKEILPNVRIGVGHGQMSENQLEQLMMDFMEGQYDVLVATTIIESGLDIPRANTIIINHADQFGLSQLYQLRGRVGRSNVQAYAYLLVPPEKILSNVAQERLKVLQELNDLGAGFKVASRDLELRGAGNLLGSEQSGHIASVGLELYTQMVERAVRKLEAQELVALDDMKVQLSFLEEKIPEEYIKSTSQRLSLYKQLSSVEDEERLWELRSAIENRFGSPPEAVLNLFKEAQVRCWGQKFGVPVIEHKGQKLRIQLLPDTQLQHENLISWLSEANTPLRFQPETTLELTQVPPSLDAILAGLQQFQQRLFLGNSAHA
jgi:transcription-repair coupling factor (superfamily II helicase)